MDRLRCDRCGCFLSPDTCVEGVDWSRGGIDPETGDWPYTGEFFCAPGKGCNDGEESAVKLIADGGSFETSGVVK